MSHSVSLPKLDYGYDELEPILSKQLVTVHHTKHHQNYVDTYNNLMVQLAEAQKNGDINKIVSLAPGIKFNLGSHIKILYHYHSILSV